MITDQFALLKKGIQLYSVEDLGRDWRWLWLRRRTKRTLVFAGYAKSFTWNRSANAADDLSITLESAEARMAMASVMVRRDKDGQMVPIDEWATP